MRVKFGAIVVYGSGSVGGHSIQNSNGGAQMRTKPINKKQPTSAQSLIRSYNKHMQQGWRDLSNANRLEWNEYPKSHGVYNKNGDKHHLSGHSFWMKLQFVFISINLPFQVDVFKAVLDPFGAEMVVNGSFVDDSDWNVGTWIVGAGEAVSVDAANLLQSGFSDFIVGLSYRIEVTVSAFTSGSLRFAIGLTPFFVTQEICCLGISIIDFTMPSNAGDFIIVQAQSDFVGSISNLSIKQIL